MGYGIMTNYGRRSESFLIKEKCRYLVDSGSGKKGENIIKNYAKICKELDCFVISHGDRDHIELSENVIKELQPKIIVISPIVYAIEKFRYTFIPSKCSIPSLFDSEYNISESSDAEYIEGDNTPWIFAKHRHSSTIQEPWKITHKKVLTEFETFPTKTSIKLAKLINNFINTISKISSHTYPWLLAIDKHRLISDLRDGKLLKQSCYTSSSGNYISMWKDIEKAILKKCRNEMSLVCRIGSSFFTGDATKKQLKELESRLIKQSDLLNNEIIIKINHHASLNDSYRYFDFYKNMKPKKLLLKRDYQIQGTPKVKLEFIQFIIEFINLVHISNFKDSRILELSEVELGFFWTF